MEVVNVIKRQVIHDFCRKHSDARIPLQTWFSVCKKAHWADYPTSGRMRAANCSLPEEIDPKEEIDNYSDLKLFTGFISAALIA